MTAETRRLSRCRSTAREATFLGTTTAHPLAGGGAKITRKCALVARFPRERAANPGRLSLCRRGSIGRLVRKAGASLTAAALHNLFAGRSRGAGAETVGFRSLPLLRLIGSLGSHELYTGY